MAQEAASSHGRSPKKPRVEIRIDQLQVGQHGQEAVRWRASTLQPARDNEQITDELQALQPARDNEQITDELQALQPAKDNKQITGKHQAPQPRPVNRASRPQAGARGPAKWQLDLAAAAAAAADAARSRDGLQDQFADKLQALQPATEKGLFYL